MHWQAEDLQGNSKLAARMLKQMRVKLDEDYPALVRARACASISYVVFRTGVMQCVCVCVCVCASALQCSAVCWSHAWPSRNPHVRHTRLEMRLDNW